MKKKKINQHQNKKYLIETRELYRNDDHGIILHCYGSNYYGTSIKTGECLFESLTYQDLLFTYWKHVGIENGFIPNPKPERRNADEYIFWSG